MYLDIIFACSVWQGLNEKISETFGLKIGPCCVHTPSVHRSEHALAAANGTSPTGVALIYFASPTCVIDNSLFRQLN